MDCHKYHKQLFPGYIRNASYIAAICKNVSDMDGPSTLDDFTGALILLQTKSIAIAVIGVGMLGSEEIIWVMSHVCHFVIVLQYPVNYIRQTVGQEGSRTQAKWEEVIEILAPLNFNPLNVL